MNVDAGVRVQTEAPSLRQRGQQEHSFHPGEAPIYTDARSAAEGKVGELRTGIDQETVRVEMFRLGPPAVIAVGDIRR